MKGTTTITVRCTSVEKQKIQNKAENAGMTISEYAKRSVLNSRSRVRKLDEDVARHIVQIQNEATALCIAQDEKTREERCIALQEEVSDLWKLLK